MPIGLKKSESLFLKSKGFRVVREVCFNFRYGNQLTVKEFDRHLLAEYSNYNVTIIMDMWRGLGSAQRVLVRDICTTTYPIHEYIQPSQQIVKDAETYISTYIRKAPFLAVIGRLEMSLLTIHRNEPIMPFCLNKTVSELQDFKVDSHLNQTFLSIDIGKYGSKKWRAKKYLTLEFTTFLNSVYGKVSIEDWEQSFEIIAQTKNAGYIALLQMVIVTRAKCILFVGGGAFQRHALHLYRQLNKQTECLKIVKACTNPLKFTL